MERTIENINESKSWFFEKIHKIDKLLARLTMKKRVKTQINKILNGKEVTTNPTEMKRIISSGLDSVLPLQGAWDGEVLHATRCGQKTPNKPIKNRADPYTHFFKEDIQIAKWDMKRCLTLLITQFSSVAQLCLTLCEPMNHRTPGLPVHHQLPETTQTHVH